LGHGRVAGCLALEQRNEVARVETVAHLMAVATEADVRERPATAPGVDPEREDPLVRPPELPGAGEDAAAIDPDREPERLAVLEREDLGRALRAAVERQRRLDAEGFAHARVAQSSREVLVASEPKRGAARLDSHVGERRDRVNAARAEQD